MLDPPLLSVPGLLLPIGASPHRAEYVGFLPDDLEASPTMAVLLYTPTTLSASLAALFLACDLGISSADAASFP